MFTVTEEAKAEILKRQIEFAPKKLIRLQMCYSCYFKFKLTLEDSIQPNDGRKLLMVYILLLIKNMCIILTIKKKLISSQINSVLRNLRRFDFSRSSIIRSNTIIIRAWLPCIPLSWKREPCFIY